MKMKTSLILLICCMAMMARAQQDQLPSGQIEVIKDFEVRLAEAKKIRIVPQPPPFDSSERKYIYKLEAPSPSIEYLVPEIKPLAIEPEQKPTYYPLMAKAGYGSPNSLLAAVSYDHVQSDVFSWGIDLDHLNANNKKIPYQKFSSTGGRINGAYLLEDKMKIDGYVDGRFEKDYFYGAASFPSEDFVKRNFSRYDVNLHMANLQSEGSDLVYKARLQYLFDKDDHGERESGINLGGTLGSAIGKKSYPVGLNLDIQFSKLKHSAEHSVNNILVSPYFDFFAGRLKLHLSGTALLKKKDNEILPGFEASYSLFNDRMGLRLGWQGSVAKNNFHYFSNLNPYITTRLDSLNNEISRKIYVGGKGTSGSLSYDLEVNYTQFTGMAFYREDGYGDGQFDVIYDDGHFIGLQGSVQYEILKHLALRASAYNRIFSLDNFEKPYMVPSFHGDGMITYTGGSDEYHVSLMVHGENGLPYRTLGGSEKRLDALADVSLRGDYYLTDSWGAFVEINNILGNKRERWVGYPSFGFNAKAGILFRLPE